MKKKFINALLLGVIITSMSAVTSCKDYDDDISALKSEITSNATTLQQLLESKESTLQTTVSTLQSQQTTLETALNEVEADLAQANTYSEQQAAAARVAAITAAQTSLNTAVETIEASITAANTAQDAKIAELLQADNDLTNAINVAKAEVQAAADAAKTAADAAQASANTNATKIAEVEASLNSVKTDLEGQIRILEGEIDAAVQQIAANKAAADAAIAQANSLIESNKMMLETADAENAAKIQANTDSLTNLAGELAKLEATTTANLISAYAYTDAAVATLAAKISEDSTKAEAVIAGALTRITTNEAAIQGLNTEFSAAVAALKASLAETDGKVSTNATDIKTLKEKASALERSVVANAADIDALEEAVSDLTSKFDSYVTTATLDTYKSAVTSEISTAITNLRNEIIAQLGVVTGNDSTVNTIQSQLTALDNKFASYVTASDFSAYKTEITGKFASVDTAIVNLGKALTDSVKKVRTEIAAVDAKIAATNTALGKQLKSLVFNPDTYYQGIEAIGVYSYNYYAVTSGYATADVTKDQSTDGVTLRRATAQTSIVPWVTADYYLNPSNAAINLDASNYKFIVNNATYTRALAQNAITVDNVWKATSGKIRVQFSVANANNISKIPTTGDGAVDVAALQYKYVVNGVDTTITSDFAALKQYVVDNFFINRASAEGKASSEASTTYNRHLALNAKDAVDAANDDTGTYPVLRIAYNDADGLDLNKWINVHYNYNDNGDQLWGDQSKINERKFNLEYELIGYIDGDNKTNESQHATISDGHILTVHGVGTEAGRQIIDRTPLIRVKLNDTNEGNRVVTLGYIKVVITDAYVAPITIEPGEFTDPYTLACTGGTAMKDAMTWLEVENLILAKLDMTKSEFEDLYELETSNGVVVQYAKGSTTMTVISPNIGDVVMTTTDKEGHMTEVLQWSITTDEAYDLFVTKNKTTVDTWVRFKPKSANSNRNSVYVKLTWTPSAINKSPKAEILDNATHKKASDWHATHSRDAGWKEIHIQCGNATQSTQCMFANMIVKNTFVKELDPATIVKNALRTTYPSLANSASVQYLFAPLSQQTSKSYATSYGTYSVTVSSDRKTIYANNAILATIAPENGEITLADNTTAKRILNMYPKGSYDLAMTFTISIEPVICDPIKTITLTNNTLDALVIKPLFLTSAKTNDMTLNEGTSLEQKVQLSFEDFNGYTPNPNDNLYWGKVNTSGISFYDFYGISSIALSGDVTTDYSGNWKNVDPNDFTITFTAPDNAAAIAKGDYGKVKLEQQNHSRANTFHVKVPIVVTYLWGELKAEIEITVTNAPGTAKQNTAR